VQGIYALAILTGTLLVIFGGITDRLIPLYAVGAFTAFTLSQAGMVMHWKRVGGPGSGKSMFINGLGAVATGITTIVVLLTKFTEGAWITVVLIPGLIWLMFSVHRHYVRIAEATRYDSPIKTDNLCPPIALIPVERWNRVSAKAVRFAWNLSAEIRVLHIECETTAELQNNWERLVAEPARKAGLPVPELVILKSPFRFVVRPIVEYTLNLAKEKPNEHIAVLIPELVERRWYYLLLHNNRSSALKALLYFKGDQRIIVINIPWYFNE
jgi:hypothetical protein